MIRPLALDDALIAQLFHCPSLSPTIFRASPTPHIGIGFRRRDGAGGTVASGGGEGGPESSTGDSPYGE